MAKVAREMVEKAGIDVDALVGMLVKNAATSTPTSRQDAEPLLAQLRVTFLPNRILTVVVEGKDLTAQMKLIPLLEGKFARDGQATAYVCENRVCDLPTTDPDIFARQIATVRPLP